ncbi:sharpin isoform X2 [Oenanthe melanoleuca]|uniref:sharpin isoform X2 n=1 Tax=Oenanthe melanoleuca TaxID=2939378 RepID=UPI0024C1B21B|nr:sharpin isoform X2 [Oenanthe melanoleuca]
MAAPGAPAAAPLTVLMAARAELAAPCRLLPSAAAAAALRLQLSVQPGTDGRRRFRLGLRLAEAGGGAPLAEFDLRDVSYRVCGPTSHELQLPAPGSGTEGTQGTAEGTQGTEGTAGMVALRFPEEREAQQWWTVLSSSLREARRAPEGDTGTAPVPPPEEPEQDTEQERELELELAQTEELAVSLSRAISRGDTVAAAQSAVALARRHAELSVTLRDSEPGAEISLQVGVEDATSSCSITLRVRPQLSIGALKEQVFREYGFHPLAQRWIIGQSLCQDGRSLRSYGIRRDGDGAFLFLLSVRAAGLGPEQYRRLQARSLLRAVGLDGHSTPGTGSVPEPPERMDVGDIGEFGDVGDIGEHLDSLQLWDSAGAPPTAPEPRPASPEQSGWPCPLCTFLNKPTRPGCEMCSSPRPEGYRVPGGHRPDPAELQRLQREQDGARQCQQALEAERQRNFQQLLRAEEAELVPNPEPLECGICLQGVPAGRGVLLRDCLHSFCRECLRQVITFSEEPVVACPFRDVTYACGSHLQEREIRALLSPEEHARFLARGLALAERRSRDSFHCRGRDCPGWCFIEDALNEFRCPVCGALNCLLCKAIHEGQNCRQYQDELQQRALNDAAARQTRDMLQKKDGCDWIRCSVCQTEICWVTKGPRWGPGGPGDTSGGCRCNVNGQRCHPQCQNCH